MPVEIIGEFGTAGAEREWIVAECELVIKHLAKICGEPPPEMELEIQWQEHDLGEYPTIVLAWEDAMCGTPCEYIARCQRALSAYENGETPPTWSRPWFAEDLEDPQDADSPDPRMPREPPADASLFEIQRYIGKLIEYGHEASVRRRHSPRLIESDDDGAESP
jgi:hypothetical protein